MASLLKLYLPNIQRRLWKNFDQVSRSISTTLSTTKKKTATPECGFEDPPQPWVSYGFDYNKESDDVNAHKSSFFFSVTLCLVGGTFVWAYAPDVHMRDWAQREAFLELRRREKDKEPVISPHFIDPKKIKLPSEEDLCDVEIII